MKLRLPHFLMTLLVATMVAPAGAAIRHEDASLQTYVDFATNSGRYVADGSTNAMLDYIRTRDQGVLINYTTGPASQALPHGMLSFDSVVDMGNATAVGYNYIVTVAHNGVLDPTFNGITSGIGGDKTIHYKGIEENSANRSFVHSIVGNGHHMDYKITRLSKIVTDAAQATIYSAPIVNGKTNMKDALVYRVGGGDQLLRTDGAGDEKFCDPGFYLVGGVGYISTWNDYSNAATGEDVQQGIISGQNSWESGKGASATTPLPFGSTGGDSGSPYFVYDGETNSFQLLLAHTGSVGGNSLYSTSAPSWTASTMEADSVHVDMASVKGALQIGGAEKADDKGGVTDTINGVSVTINAATGFLRDDGGNLYDKNWNSISFKGVATGQHTWKDLSGLQNNNSWYAYDNSYLNATESVLVVNKENVAATGITYAELYQTQNLVFDAAASNATYGINVTADTDLGVGYLHFAADKVENVVFNVSSEKNNLLNSAGYVVDKGVTVNVSLRNTDASYMREWRKVGEGTLNICGEGGNNEIFLNVGGKGATLLNQKDGYAAYNVLVNTGSTVKIKDTQQIYRDLTFGNGGGTLDMNGNSMDWYTTNGDTRAGFTIQALTEEAIISNSSATKAVLTFKEAGAQQFVGSFQDSANSALGIVYDGGGTWELNSIHTSLQHADSGLTVNSGTVRLSGTHTVHGEGSATGRDTARYTNDNDWHYADATMNVTVEKGGSFELASHARLTGDVTVKTGGVYIMREGVNHEKEYIEGGESLESTSGEIAKYYGHKGDVKLADGAEMMVQYTAGPDTDTTYAHDVTGHGKLVIDLGTDAAAFNMTGKVAGLAQLDVQDKSRLRVQNIQDVELVSVSGEASLTLQNGSKDLLKVEAVGKQVDATLSQVSMSSTSATEAKISGSNGETGLVQSAQLKVQADTVLVLDNVSLAQDVQLVLAGAGATVLVNQAELTLTATNTMGAEVGVASSITLKGCGIADQLRLETGDAVCRMVSNALMGAITVQGSSLLVDMSALGDLNGYDAVQLSFGDITSLISTAALGEAQNATFGDLSTMSVTALMADGKTWNGFYNAQDSSSVYFAYVPEPTTTTLSLVALAALCARRRRKMA